MKSNYNFGRASLSNVDSGAATMGGREGIKKCEKREKRAPFIGEEGQPPRGVRQPKGEIILLFISLFMVVTLSS
jgi:hypothetical protein